MEAFKQIRAWAVEQEAARGDGSAVAIVGTAVCAAIMKEAEDEASRITHGSTPKNDTELLIHALQQMKGNFESAVSDAEHLIERQSVAILEECAYRAAERSRRESKLEERPIIFAIWTGVAANFAWLFVSFLIVLAAMLILGAPPIEDVIRNNL